MCGHPLEALEIKYSNTELVRRCADRLYWCQGCLEIENECKLKGGHCQSGGTFGRSTDVVAGPDVPKLKCSLWESWDRTSGQGTRQELKKQTYVHLLKLGDTMRALLGPVQWMGWHKGINRTAALLVRLQEASSCEAGPGRCLSNYLSAVSPSLHEHSTVPLIIL